MSELLKGSTLTAEQAGFTDSIRVCADTLLTVINDILDYSKLDAGKMVLHNIPMSLKETISEVVRALSYSHKQKDVKTITNLDIDNELLVMGDPVRFHQILMSKYISNSHTGPDKHSLTTLPFKIYSATHTSLHNKVVSSSNSSSTAKQPQKSKSPAPCTTPASASPLSNKANSSCPSPRPIQAHNAHSAAQDSVSVSSKPLSRACTREKSGWTRLSVSALLFPSTSAS